MRSTILKILSYTAKNSLPLMKGGTFETVAGPYPVSYGPREQNWNLWGILPQKLILKSYLSSQPNFPCKSQIQTYNVSSCLNSCPTCLIDLGLGSLYSNRSQFLLWRTQTDIFIMLSQSSKLGHYEESGNIPMQHIPLSLPPYSQLCKLLFQ